MGATVSDVIKLHRRLVDMLTTNATDKVALKVRWIGLEPLTAVGKPLLSNPTFDLFWFGDWLYHKKYYSKVYKQYNYDASPDTTRNPQ